MHYNEFLRLLRAYRVTRMPSDETFVICRRESYLRWDCQEPTAKSVIILHMVTLYLLIYAFIVSVIRKCCTTRRNTPSPRRIEQGEAGAQGWTELGKFESRALEGRVPGRKPVVVGAGRAGRLAKERGRLTEFGMQLSCREASTMVCLQLWSSLQVRSS